MDTDTRRLNCPRCASSVLDEQPHGGVVVDRCGQCGGIWLDMLELEKVVSARPIKLVSDDGRFEARPDEPGPRLNCPHCKNVYLIKLNSRLRPGTIIDSCQVCFGTWLDAGELTRMVERGAWDWIGALYS